MTEALSRFHIANAVVTILPDRVESFYPSYQATSLFYPPIEDNDFQKVAEQTGYADASFQRNHVMQFGLEHDLLHHFVAAFVLNRPYSRVVLKEARKCGDGLKLGWPYRGDDEEHLTLFLQEWLTKGEPPRPPHPSLQEILDNKKQEEMILLSKTLLIHSGLRLA